MKRLALLALLALSCTPTRPPADPHRSAEHTASPGWLRFDDDAFAQATGEDKLVLLHLGAVWCHWCHVMEHETYTDPTVLSLIETHYIPVYVDSDARPDVAHRFRRWAWPATIVFDAQGRVLARWKGYIEAPEFAARLERIARHPEPLELPPAPPLHPDALLSETTRAELRQGYRDTYNLKHAGWGFKKKLLNGEDIEYALFRGFFGDSELRGWATDSADAALALIDPVWGGIYQYSHGGVWTHPHFEKLATNQAEALRIYGLLYAAFGHLRYAQAMADISRYVQGHLMSEEGAFYTTQDADLVPGEHSGDYFALDNAGRWALGVPRVDTHIYARENGLLIEGFASAYAATGESEFLRLAERAAELMIASHGRDDGGFRHAAEDTTGPYLTDQLGMGRGFLALYLATSEPRWLDRASHIAAFIPEHFAAQSGGFLSAAAPNTTLSALQPTRILREHVQLARWSNHLSHITGNPDHVALAEQAMRYVAAPEIAQRAYEEGELLLVAEEMAREPVHITVVGPRNQPEAAALYDAARRYPMAYKRVDWWDPSQPPLPNTEVVFPTVGEARAYICSDGTCSRPITDPTQIERAIDAHLGVVRGEVL